MLAIGLDFHARRPVEFSLPEPPPPSGAQLLLRIREVGLCGTDRELARFHFGAPPPGEHHLALGHEALAEVVAAGPLATLAPGALVVPFARRPCAPACSACTRLRRDLCTSGLYTERGITGLHGYLRPLALDDQADLLPIPPSLSSVAVLAEPLSVVEKALDTALRLHPLQPRSVLILGAGPVGLLAALASAARDWHVELASLEPPDHPHARLARAAGARYSHRTPAAPADIVLECAGSPAAAPLGLQFLKPAGVMVLIGASDFQLDFPGLRTVLLNQTLTGVVNASPAHFAAAIDDLARFPRPLLESLIHRQSLPHWPDALAHPGAQAPKSVLTLS